MYLLTTFLACWALLWISSAVPCVSSFGGALRGPSGKQNVGSACYVYEPWLWQLGAFTIS